MRINTKRNALTELALIFTCFSVVITQKVIMDFALTSDMKSSDFDSPTSKISKLIKFIVNKPKPVKNSEYLTLEKGKNHVELGISIKSDSIFVPGGDEKNTQSGFRSARFFSA